MGAAQDPTTAMRPEVEVEEVAALAARAFGLDAVRIEPLPGERDRNFLVAEGSHAAWVVKVLHPGEDPAVSDFQSRALEHLARTDPSLPVPRLRRPVGGDRGLEHLWVRDGHAPQRVRCVSYLVGRPVASTPSTSRQRVNLGRFLARLDDAFAAFRHSAEEQPDLLWNAHRAERVRPLLHAIEDPERRALAASVLDGLAAHGDGLRGVRRQVIHNDFNPQNVLVDAEDPDAVVGVIDFGDLLRAPLVQDLATTCAYLTVEGEHPLDLAADVTAAYQGVRALSTAEHTVLPALIGARLVLSATISAWRAQREPANASYLLRNQVHVWRNLERLAEDPGP